MRKRLFHTLIRVTVHEQDGRQYENPTPCLEFKMDTKLTQALSWNRNGRLFNLSQAPNADDRTCPPSVQPVVMPSH